MIINVIYLLFLFFVLYIYYFVDFSDISENFGKLFENSFLFISFYLVFFLIVVWNIFLSFELSKAVYDYQKNDFESEKSDLEKNEMKGDLVEDCKEDIQAMKEKKKI